MHPTGRGDKPQQSVVCLLAARPKIEAVVVDVVAEALAVADEPIVEEMAPGRRRRRYLRGVPAPPLRCRSPGRVRRGAADQVQRGAGSSGAGSRASKHGDAAPRAWVLLRSKRAARPWQLSDKTM